MSVIYDVSANGTDTVVSPKTWSHTVPAGNNRLLVVQLCVQGQGATAATVTAVTYGGVAMTKVLTSTGANATPVWKNEVTYWFLLRPAVGTGTISATITAPTSLPDYGGYSVDFQGASQSLTPDATGTNTSTATGAINTSITPVAQGAYILAAINTMNDGSTAGTVASSQTQRANFLMSTNVNGILAAEDTNGGVNPGATNMTFTYTGGTGFTNVLVTTAAVSIAPSTSGSFRMNSLRPHPFSPGLAR